MSILTEYKSKRLRKLLAQLIEEHEILTSQIGCTLDGVDRVRLTRRVMELECQIGKTEKQLHDEANLEDMIIRPQKNSIFIEDLQRALNTSTRTLVILEQKAAGFTSLTIPSYLQIELEDKRKEVSQLENDLRLAIQSLESPKSE